MDLQLSCAKYDVIFDQQNTFLNMYEKINVHNIIWYNMLIFSGQLQMTYHVLFHYCNLSLFHAALDKNFKTRLGPYWSLEFYEPRYAYIYAVSL